MSVNLMSDTIDHIALSGKGILAADESTGTIGKRFSAINVSNTDEHRRQYRSLLSKTPNLGEFISGIILFEETLGQKDDSNVLLPEVLKAQNVMVGIKVDQGLCDFTNYPNEKITKGLDTLYERLGKYKEQGARFAKWRNVLVISKDTPSPAVVLANSEVLARYAAICQNHGIVPIVEPEILMAGNHSMQRCAEVTEYVLKELFKALDRHKVKLEYTILKPNMVLPGKDCDEQRTNSEIAEATFEVLKRSVPNAVPCINFLSGGQTPIQASERLNELNNLGDKPWILSFSYGRALQEPVIQTWLGKTDNVKAAQDSLILRSKLNSLASLGKYNSQLEMNGQ